MADDQFTNGAGTIQRPPTNAEHFDRLIGALDGLPDTTKTKTTTIRTVTPLIGMAQTFTLQTYRMREQGDYVFLEYVGVDGFFRLALPPAVTAAISRQRDSLTTKTRSQIARAAAESRRAAGHVPTFTPAMRAKALATRKRNAAARKRKRKG